MSLSATFNRGPGRISARKVSGYGRVNFDLFFDKPEVRRRLDAKEQKVLGGTGAFSRGVMRRSIRKAGKRYKPSEHTGPPRYHTRGFGSLKDGIFFQFSLRQGSVVIGPNKLATNVRPTGGAQSSAQLINEGGTGVITSFRYNKPTRAGRPRPGKWKTRRGRWKERSFTKPARQPTRAKMLELMEKVQL